MNTSSLTHSFPGLYSSSNQDPAGPKLRVVRGTPGTTSPTSSLREPGGSHQNTLRWSLHVPLEYPCSGVGVSPAHTVRPGQNSTTKTLRG